jgi:hypothetical protein
MRNDMSMIHDLSTFARVEISFVTISCFLSFPVPNSSCQPADFSERQFPACSSSPCYLRLIHLLDSAVL